ncbi:hypothetical protein LCGC14_1849680 [marine sediment metagenome]|uniref:Lipoprotein n=1 Tax=marine sediment metagenome TaxID=412755 RepID=A0A0F9JA13_9ZZZZ
MKRLLLLLAVALSVSSCANWFTKPEPVVQVRYKSLAYPYMNVPQTKTFIACMKAIGGNEKRRKRMGEQAVAEALKQCQENFDVFDTWWPVYVKMSDAYDKLDVR